MIAKDSTSYPYLSIAQHYNISYAEVLAESDKYDRFLLRVPYTDWRFEVWLLERKKKEIILPK